MSKARIFEIYLNVIEWGDRVWGAEAAARTYFGVPAASLSRQQSALLAGAIINPQAVHPSSADTSPAATSAHHPRSHGERGPAQRRRVATAPDLDIRRGARAALSPRFRHSVDEEEASRMTEIAEVSGRVGACPVAGRESTA